MRWQIHGERTVYNSDWLRIGLADVELPDGRRFEHHVVRMPQPAAGVIMRDARGVLLLWRHRFITDSWGWEIPAGRVEQGETPEHAAAREGLEETGWQPGPLEHLVTFHPSNGSSDQTFHIFLARGATRIGEPQDAHEAERIEWMPLDRVMTIMQRKEMPDGLSLTALSFALAMGRLADD